MATTARSRAQAGRRARAASDRLRDRPARRHRETFHKEEMVDLEEKYTQEIDAERTKHEQLREDAGARAQVVPLVAAPAPGRS